MKKRVFSGAAPSGILTIGNLIGAISNWKKLQNDYEAIFCVVDLHAITTKQNPLVLKESIREFVKSFIACGIDPEKSTIFVQSHIKEHAELAWILGCYTQFGPLSRMTQFKEKSKKHKENVNIGLFSYPILMAADILLYQTDLVPVGSDQIQHIEFTRDLAERFNHLYQSQIFKIPQAFISEEGSRIMSLLDPKSKMSKSDTNKNNIIALRDKPDEIRGKIKKAVTDSGKEVKAGKDKPALTNLLTIYSFFSQKPIAEIEKDYIGKGYAEFKKDLAEVIIMGLQPIQQKLLELDANPDYLEKILKTGEERIRPIAQKTIFDVKNKIGLG